MVNLNKGKIIDINAYIDSESMKLGLYNCNVLCKGNYNADHYIVCIVVCLLQFIIRFCLDINKNINCDTTEIGAKPIN